MLGVILIVFEPRIHPGRSAFVYGLTFLFGVLTVVSMACNLPILKSAVQLTSTPASGSSSPTVRTAERQAMPKNIASPFPEVTSMDPQCVRHQAETDLPPLDYRIIEGSVLEYANQGASIGELSQALNAAGVANQPTAVLSGDMTGDGKNDLVVSVFDPQSKHIPPAGKLIILVCEGGKFGVEYEQPTPGMYGGPHLWYLQDLNADRKADLVDSLATCGAHTCFESLRVIAWGEQGFTNRLDGDTGELPYPLTEVRDLNGDGVYDIEVSGTGAGSVGAGPPRSVTWVFSYDTEDEFWHRSDVVLAEAKFRIHVVNDADALALEGNFREALIAYQRVLDDPELQDWVDPETERANLQAYARFKRVVIFLLLDQEQFAESAYQEMVNLYPSDTHQYGYLQMAEEFRRVFPQGGVSDACKAANAFAAAHQEAVLAPLNAYGYGNSSYTAQNMCPFDSLSGRSN
jgi:tetratricopeptide (TPR) repeat protein